MHPRGTPELQGTSLPHETGVYLLPLQSQCREMCRFVQPLNGNLGSFIVPPNLEHRRHVLYPKICPPISHQVCQESSSHGSKIAQEVAQLNHLQSQSKLGFRFFQWIWGFQWLNQVSCAYIHPQTPTCQVSRLTVSNSKIKSPIWSTVNCRGKWSFHSQKS